MRDRKFFMFFNFVFSPSHELFLTAKIYQITVVVSFKDSTFTQGQVTNPEARCPRENPAVRIKGETLRQILLVAGGQVSQEC